MEALRGGILFLVRWFVQYPVVFSVYRVRNWARSPFMLDQNLQGKPGILVANYGNYFYDDTLGMMLAPVWPFSFVREPYCEFPLLKWWFRFFRALPAIRRSDSALSSEELVQKHNELVDRASGLLRKGHWMSVFPEVHPVHRSTLSDSLKPGAAQVALRAEDASGWSLGLGIYVYGINYENKFIGRSRVYIQWADPIEVASYRERYSSNALSAEKELMAEIERRLRACVLEAPTLVELEDAHRLAFQRREAGFDAAKRNLEDVVAKRAAPEAMRNIVCGKRRGSILYQAIGLGFVTVGWAIGTPFRLFGKLCSKDRSEEMSYQFMLWLIVLATGFAVSQQRWVIAQCLATWVVMNTWLWAWRRGLIDENESAPNQSKVILPEQR